MKGERNNKSYNLLFTETHTHTLNLKISIKNKIAQSIKTKKMLRARDCNLQQSRHK